MPVTGSLSQPPPTRRLWRVLVLITDQARAWRDVPAPTATTETLALLTLGSACGLVSIRSALGSTNDSVTLIPP